MVASRFAMAIGLCPLLPLPLFHLFILTASYALPLPLWHFLDLAMTTALLGAIGIAFVPCTVVVPYE
jgi:hypothetical protein